MGMLTGNFPDFVNGVSARIDEIVENFNSQAPMSWEESGLFKKVDASSAQDDGNGKLIYRTSGAVGLGDLEKFDEMDNIPEDRMYEGYQTEYVIGQYGKKVVISQLLAYTMSSEVEKKLDKVKQLSIAQKRTLNRHAWQVIKDGFVTTDSVANLPIARLSDAKAMFSTAHPSLATGVSARSNASSTGIALNETNLFTATKAIAEQLDGRGKPLEYEGRFLLVIPKALEKTAVEITKSVKRAGTANNDINYYEGIVDVMSVVQLGASNGGSDTAWYVFALDVEDKGLRCAMLIEPKIEHDVNFDNKSIMVTIDGAWAFGYTNWEYCWGSKGAGVAYSG